MQNKRDPMTWAYWFTRTVVWLVGKFYFRVRILGAENIPKSGPVILAAGPHTSYLDGLLISLTTGRFVRFLVLEAFFRMPIIGRILTGAQCVPINVLKGKASGTSALRALRKMLEHLNEKRCIMIFPQGKIEDLRIPWWEKLHEPNDVNPGLGWLIEQTDEVPIIPVRICGAGKAWPKHAKFPKPRRIAILVGQPIVVDCKIERPPKNAVKLATLYYQVRHMELAQMVFDSIEILFRPDGTAF